MIREMTDQELFEKNLVLTTEFNRYVLEHPEVTAKIAKDAVVVILADSFDINDDYK